MRLGKQNKKSGGYTLEAATADLNSQWLPQELMRTPTVALESDQQKPTYLNSPTPVLPRLGQPLIPALKPFIHGMGSFSFPE